LISSVGFGFLFYIVSFINRHSLTNNILQTTPQKF